MGRFNDKSIGDNYLWMGTCPGCLVAHLRLPEVRPYFPPKIADVHSYLHNRSVLYLSTEIFWYSTSVLIWTLYILTSSNWLLEIQKYRLIKYHLRCNSSIVYGICLTSIFHVKQVETWSFFLQILHIMQWRQGGIDFAFSQLSLNCEYPQFTSTTSAISRQNSLAL